MVKLLWVGAVGVHDPNVLLGAHHVSGRTGTVRCSFASVWVQGSSPIIAPVNRTDKDIPGAVAGAIFAFLILVVAGAIIAVVWAIVTLLR